MHSTVKLSCLAVLAGAVASGWLAERKPGPAPALPAAISSATARDRGLAGTKWSLEEIDGKPVIANSRASLDFPNNSSVAGNGSCNRFTGTVEITGSHMKFGPLAATRMMCDEDSSRQESAYLKALAEVDRYEVLNRLTLYLYLKDRDKPLKLRAIL